MNHAELLAEIPIFEGLSDADREALALRMTEKAYKPAGRMTVFVHAGATPALSMYIVLSGAAQIFLPAPDATGDPVVLKDVRTGEYFGELALFDSKPRSASVKATLQTTLLELTRDEFAEHLSRSKTAALAILSEMAERLRETNAMLDPARHHRTRHGKEIEENLTWGQRLLADKFFSPSSTGSCRLSFSSSSSG